MQITTITRYTILVAALAALTGCAGVRVGPGTTTGVVGGTIIGAVNGNAGKGALIGGGVGAVLDILSGREPVEVDPRYAPGSVYRDGRIYREERRYYPAPVYRDDRRYAPAPVYREPRYWRECGCYR